MTFDFWLLTNIFMRVDILNMPLSSQLAFVFPGQGSQSLGMLAELGSEYAIVKATFDEASAGAGVDLWALSQSGPEDLLNRTDNTQPALLAAGVAVWRTWQELGGHRRLALQNVNGIATVADSDDPTSVLQLVPLRRSAALNLTVLLGSLAILTLAVVLWPITYWVRRHYQRPLSEGRKPRTVLRVAALLDLVWLAAWFIVLTPVLSIELDFYSTALDPVIRTLQVAGVLVIALATVGLWNLWRLCGTEASWTARIGNGLIAAALIGFVWIGVIGGLISFNLNY